MKLELLIVGSGARTSSSLSRATPSVAGSDVRPGVGFGDFKEAAERALAPEPLPGTVEPCGGPILREGGETIPPRPARA